MLRAGVVLLLSVLAASAHAQFKPDQPYKVPSDLKGEYRNLSIEGSGRYRKIKTERKGPSGTSYALREYDCQAGKFRYLEEGDELDAMKKHRDPKWGDVTDGSISSYVGAQACQGFNPYKKLRAPT